MAFANFAPKSELLNELLIVKMHRLIIKDLLLIWMEYGQYQNQIQYVYIFQAYYPTGRRRAYDSRNKAVIVKLSFRQVINGIISAMQSNS